MCESSAKLVVPAPRRSLPILPDQLVDNLAPVLAKLCLLEKIAGAHTKLLNEIVRRLPEEPSHTSSVPRDCPSVSAHTESAHVAALKTLTQKLGNAQEEAHLCRWQSTQAESIKLLASEKHAPRRRSVETREGGSPTTICGQPNSRGDKFDCCLEEKANAQKGSPGAPLGSTIRLSSNGLTAAPTGRSPYTPEVRETSDQRSHLSTPPLFRWMPLKKVRLARYRAWREIEASPVTPHANGPVRAVTGEHGSPLLELQKSPESQGPHSIEHRNAATIRAASTCPRQYEGRRSPSDSMETDDLCLICLLQKSDSMHLAKPTLFRLECGHEFHLHCLSEIVQRRECRKECAVCLLPLSREQSAAIMSESKTARKNPEVRIYQQQLFDALARLTSERQLHKLRL